MIKYKRDVKKKPDNNDNDKNEELTYVEREFGTEIQHDHDKEFKQLLILLIGFLIIAAILCWKINWGIYIFMVLLALMTASVPIFLYVIRIPMVVVLEVNLGEHTYYSKIAKDIHGNEFRDAATYDLIDKVNIYTIPLHLFDDYDVVGNMPPFRNNAGQLIYICDKFDMERKIIHLAVSELFSNLRYVVHKNTFIELKDEYMQYVKLSLRQLLTQEVSIGFGVKHALKRGVDAFLNEQEKFVYDRDYGQKEGDVLPTTDDIIKYLSDIKTQKLKDTQAQVPQGGIKNV